MPAVVGNLEGKELLPSPGQQHASSALPLPDVANCVPLGKRIRGVAHDLRKLSNPRTTRDGGHDRWRPRRPRGARGGHHALDAAAKARAEDRLVHEVLADLQLAAGVAEGHDGASARSTGRHRGQSCRGRMHANAGALGGGELQSTLPE